MILLAILMLPASGLKGQPFDIPAPLNEKLAVMQLDLLLPVDSDYRLLPPRQDEFQSCDLALRSRSEKMEIRYLAHPWKEENTTSGFPQILAARTVTHVATNAPEAPITLLSLGAGDLQLFNADWGVEYVFTPKPEFSEHRFGKLLVLFKEQRGTLMVFYLFDDPDNPAIDLRYQSLIFQ